VLSTALATGVLFARLSRPQSRVLFSNVVVVRPFQGVPTLMFRIVNERRSEITEARIAVTITGDEVDEDGTVLRRMYALKLERDHSPVFALSWLIMHKIDESSPLHGKVTDEIAASGNVMVCAFTGIDDTVGASLRARHIYGAENVRFGHRFVDVIERKETGEMTIDLRHFHDTIAIDVLP